MDFDCRLPCTCAYDKPTPIVYDIAERILWEWNYSATSPCGSEGFEELNHIIRNYALGLTNISPQDRDLRVICLCGFVVPHRFGIMKSSSPFYYGDNVARRRFIFPLSIYT